MIEPVFTAHDKLECARRELKLRERVYADRVRRGKMSQELATREIRLMRAIAADYEAQAAGERLL